jgi:hypothetical protein
LIDVKKYIFVEGLAPYTHFRFMTDLDNKFTTVKKENFIDALKTTFHFSKDEVEDIIVKLSSGMVLMLDIEEKTNYRYDGMESVVTGGEVVRGPAGGNSSVSIYNQEVVDFVNKSLRD